MNKELLVLMDNRLVGVLASQANGKLMFSYNEDWQQAVDGYPLSISMPLSIRHHDTKVCESFLWGLLPDNPLVLERWAKQFQVSPRNAFALITHVGEDCAGGVQFVRPDRLPSMLSGQHDDIEWLSEAQLAERLKMLHTDQAAWRLTQDIGQFSLAGAQPKTALVYLNNQWGIPRGRIPTTHILKPPTNGFAGHTENEHLCLQVASKLAMPSVSSAILQLEGQIAIAVERYDRIIDGATIKRIHQEDLCQALGIMPTKKNQSDGGPGVTAIANLLKVNSNSPYTDLRRFIDAIIFNFLIVGTDAHAKNYSILISSNQQIRLAPLYDIASMLPYAHSGLHKTKLSMHIGGEYKVRNILQRQFARMAIDVDLNIEEVLGRLQDISQRLPDAVAEVAQEVTQQGMNPEIVKLLTNRIINRAAEGLRLSNSLP